jgi:hypothetical protein
MQTFRAAEKAPRPPPQPAPTQCCSVGWVDFVLFYIFNRSTPEICYIPSKSTENSKKKSVWPSDRFIIGHDFLGHGLYKGPTFFIRNMDFMRIKKRRIDSHTKRPITKRPITKWPMTQWPITKGPITYQPRACNDPSQNISSPNDPGHETAHHEMPQNNTWLSKLLLIWRNKWKISAANIKISTR